MAQETLIEKITTAFDEHVDVINSIMHDCVESGLITEVETACDNFQRTLRVYDSDETEVEAYIKRLDDIEFQDEQLSQLVHKLVKHEDFDKDFVLEHIDESEVADWLADKGYICVKLQTMDQMEKLKEFIQTEIYPHVNEQNELINF